MPARAVGAKPEHAAVFAAVGAASALLLWLRTDTRRSRHVWHAGDVNVAWICRVLAPLIARNHWHVRGCTVRALGGKGGQAVDGYRPGYGGVGAVVDLHVGPTPSDGEAASTVDAAGSGAAEVTGGGARSAPAPAPVCAASCNPRVFVKFSQSQHATWVAHKAELRFWRRLAPLLRGRVTLPQVHSAESHGRKYALVFEDVVHSLGATHGDQADGATRTQAFAAVRTCARLHASFRGYAATTPGGVSDHPWTTEGVFCASEEARFARALAGSEVAVPEALVARYAAGELRASEFAVPPAIAQAAARVSSPAGHAAVVAACNLTPATATAVHGDFRLDNMLFVAAAGKRQPDVVLVDWAHLGYQTGLWDVAYFLGTSLRVTDRRAWVDELLRAYHAEVLRTPRLDGSAVDADEFTLEQCWREYRAASARLWNYYLGAGFTGLVAHPPAWMSDHMAMAPMLQSFVERITWQLLDVGAAADDLMSTFSA